MQNKTVGWGAAVLLIAVVAVTGKTGLPESDPAPGGSGGTGGSAATTAPDSGEVRIRSRLKQDDHYLVWLTDDREIKMSLEAGEHCLPGDRYPC
ncbi:hypothetical protein GWI34_16055 [Actinomadura sp. DSM 109109]|nr:hypothetical protein [Actinomadura lepetitiana]